ncbi:MAG TPA: hypothetical protein VK324_09550, partial [Tepidisphaeraceae bacterium]|nr:hypothetical protein [Tepidisphaeraceae bacterium]
MRTANARPLCVNGISYVPPPYALTQWSWFWNVARGGLPEHGFARPPRCFRQAMGHYQAVCS